MEQGGYIYIQDNQPFLFIFRKSNADALMRALPLSYKNDNNNYMCAVFDLNGRDYIGQSNISDIEKMLSETENNYILDKDYNQISDSIQSSIDIELYNRWKEFANSQLENM